MKTRDSKAKQEAPSAVRCSALLCRRLGMVVRITRNVKGMTLPELAELSGVAKSNLSMWENDGVNVTIETLCRVSEALGTTPQKMLDAAA